MLEQAIWKMVKAFTQDRHCRARKLQRKNWLVEFFFCKYILKVSCHPVLPTTTTTCPSNQWQNCNGPNNTDAATCHHCHPRHRRRTKMHTRTPGTTASKHNTARILRFIRSSDHAKPKYRRRWLVAVAQAIEQWMEPKPI